MRLARGGVEERHVARRRADHPFNQIDAHHLLGHAVFYLQPSVDLEEEEIFARRVVEEFHRPRRAVARGLAEAHRRRDQPGARRGGQVGSGRFLDDFLVATLQRAIAFAERDDPACAVAENLHLDMAGAFDIAFEEHARIAEISGALTHDPGETLAHFRFVAANSHADAAAARRRLEHDRIADCRRRRCRILDIDQQVAARRKRHAVFDRQRARAVL